MRIIWMRWMLYAGSMQFFFWDERPSISVTLHVEKLLDFGLILYVINAAMFHHRLLRRLSAKLSTTSPCVLIRVCIIRDMRILL